MKTEKQAFNYHETLTEMKTKSKGELAELATKYIEFFKLERDISNIHEKSRKELESLILRLLDVMKPQNVNMRTKQIGSYITDDGNNTLQEVLIDMIKVVGEFDYRKK